jgi:hypothetical protein
MNSATNFVDSCSDLYDFEAFKTDLTAKCNGQKNCTLTNPAQHFTTGASLSANYSQCSTMQALFFV